MDEEKAFLPPADPTSDDEPLLNLLPPTYFRSFLHRWLVTAILLSTFLTLVILGFDAVINFNSRGTGTVIFALVILFGSISLHVFVIGGSCDKPLPRPETFMRREFEDRARQVYRGTLLFSRKMKGRYFGDVMCLWSVLLWILSCLAITALLATAFYSWKAAMDWLGDEGREGYSKDHEDVGSMMVSILCPLLSGPHSIIMLMFGSERIGNLLKLGRVARLIKKQSKHVADDTVIASEQVADDRWVGEIWGDWNDKEHRIVLYKER